MKRKRTPSQWSSEHGAKLRALRQARGDWLTTYRLAELTDYSDSLISLVETGKQRPTPKFLYAIAPHLGTRVEHLLLLAGYINDAQQWEGAEPDPAADALQEVGLALSRGPWSETTAALMYAVLAELADNRVQFWRDKFEAAIEEVRASRFYGRGESGGAPFTQDEIEEATITRIRSRIFPT